MSRGIRIIIIYEREWGMGKRGRRRRGLFSLIYFFFCSDSISFGKVPRIGVVESRRMFGNWSQNMYVHSAIIASEW